MDDHIIEIVFVSVVIITGTSFYLYSNGFFNSLKSEKPKSSKSQNSSKESTKTTSKTGTSKNSSSCSSSSENKVWKGYKKTDDGRIRTYFHRDLKPEDRELIGDCTPKRISTSNISSSSSSSSATKENKTESAWNTAGTWEEKDYSKWAKRYLSEAIKKLVYSIPENKGVVSVLTVDSIEGDASTVHVRNRKKFIYDFSLTYTWKVKLNDKLFTEVEGKCSIADITSDCLYDITVTIPNYNILMPSDTRQLIDDYVLSTSKGMKKNLVDLLNRFLQDFQNLSNSNS